MSFGIPELLVILVIVILLFGTKKLKSLGSDLGSALKGFRKAVSTEEEPKESTKLEADTNEDDPDKTLFRDQERSENKQP